MNKPILPYRRLTRALVFHFFFTMRHFVLSTLCCCYIGQHILRYLIGPRQSITINPIFLDDLLLRCWSRRCEQAVAQHNQIQFGDLHDRYSRVRCSALSSIALVITYLFTRGSALSLVNSATRALVCQERYYANVCTSPGVGSMNWIDKV